MAQALASALHGYRARALGGASDASRADICVGLAAPESGRFPRPVFPLAGKFCSPSLWLRFDHAGCPLDSAQGIHRDLSYVVDRGPGDPVLASHRALTSARPGPLSPQPNWLARSSEFPADGFPQVACRDSPFL